MLETNYFDSGFLIGHWRIVRYIGQGRSGTVYEVKDIYDETVSAALKIWRGNYLKASKMDFDHEILQVKKQIIKGFMPAFYEQGEHERQPYYVMELADALPQRLSRMHLKTTIQQACDALILLHSEGYLHCDIKPINLGVINEKVVLLDWGSCRRIDDVITMPARVGTWNYMAPEVRDRIKLDVQADIYSLAATLDEFCSRNGLRRTYESLILHGMANNTDKRIKTIDEFLHEFNTSRDRLTKFSFVTLTTGSVLALVITLIIAYLALDFRREEKLTESRNRESIVLSANINTAVSFYLTGKFLQSYDRFLFAMQSPDYNPTNFPTINIESIFEDCCRRLNRPYPFQR